MEYRQLDEKEIRQLEDNNCWAEDWQRVMVADDFNPNAVRNVTFYGDVKLGSFDKSIEVSKTFMRRTGVYNATLRNVTIGNNSLIENVGNYINNYVIGSDCYISNICTMETTEGATYGEGNIISVLNEVGEGNVVSYHGLTSQIAALMVRHAGNNAFRTAIRRLVAEYIQRTTPDTGTIGNGVKIVNTKEVTNTVVYNDCEINGAARISDCTIMSSPEASVFIGTGVICENSIIAHGSSIINSVKMQDCFVGEACKLSNGFTAAQSVFFANSYMSNGEACAAFCGPFSSSHHKSSLIIGGMFSFYNAGSATNFSNHAYKMGPIHYGTLERGSKTASGAYLLMPAHIGTFSVCFGKLMYHPDTRSLPFSYLIAYGDIMYLVPGRNLTTVGLYRDIRKWPKRDMRSKQSQKSIVNFDWLSPFSVGEIIQGKKILERLREASGDNVSTYNYHEYVIKTSSLRKGIKYYDIALRIFMGAVLKRHALVPPISTVGTGKWNDLSGLLLPDSEEQQLVSDIADGTIESMDDIVDRLNAINDNYNEYRWAWAYRMILDYYGLSEITPQDAERIHTDYITARRAWIAEIKKDAEKEYQLGDVEDSVLQNIVSQLDKEIDFENMTLYK
jgi:hypothetical protein